MSDDVELLTEKARQSLAAARLLFDQGYHDFASSRAYYSMFYMAEALLASLGQSFSSHGGVVSAYGREFAKVEKLDAKYHRWLIDSQDIRNIGDYGVGAGISNQQAAQVIAQADEFMAAGAA